MVERMDEVVGRVGDHRLEPKQLVAIEMEGEDMRVRPEIGNMADAPDGPLAMEGGVEGADMRALVLTKYGGPEAAELREVPRPRLQAQEVLVRVHAAGLNPVDFKTREGKLKVVQRYRCHWSACGIARPGCRPQSSCSRPAKEFEPERACSRTAT